MIHEINCSSSTANEEDLHDSVVETDEAGEQVQVPGDEHHQEQDLGLAGDAGTAASLPYLHEEQDYGQEVRQVTKQSKYIHLLCNTQLLSTKCILQY